MAKTLLGGPAAALALWVSFGGPASALAETWRFDFGSGKWAGRDTRVTPETLYTPERGYGFEPGAPLEAVGKKWDRDDYITSSQPFSFSLRAPKEGNYRVTVVLGNREGVSETTITAELRRLMAEKITTEKKHFEEPTFLVNVRRPQIAGGGEVRLKDREKGLEAAAWDDKLTLTFSGSHPAVCGLRIETNDRVPTVFIAGDSTSTDQPKAPYNSWGQMITRFFDSNIAVANHGESGESLRSFIGERRLEKIWSVARKGDYLLVQFGHNDQKEKGEGVGAFTTYKTDLKRVVREARDRGVTPILITSMHRLNWGPGGKIVNTLGDYPEAVRQVAREEGVGLVDLNAMSKVFYESLGKDKAPEAFAPGDLTHHSDFGSYELAKCVVDGILQNQLPLAKYLGDPHFKVPK